MPKNTVKVDAEMEILQTIGWQEFNPSRIPCKTKITSGTYYEIWNSEEIVHFYVSTTEKFLIDAELLAIWERIMSDADYDAVDCAVVPFANNVKPI